MFIRSSHRRRIATAVIGLIVCAVAGGSTTANAQTADVPLAPELTGLGTLQMPVTTSFPRAQRFFDQGMRLLYAFNHTEAIRAFREAARLDPELAMAYWGQALALGPNLNAPMTRDNGRLAYAAAQQAMKRRSHASSRERALIEALALRYADDGVGDRSVLNRLYATAMETVAARFAGDPDVGTLYADAQMNTMPWDYWQKDGSAKSATADVLATLESIIARNPDHPGAIHYHIHVLEASDDPDRAVRSADRLGSLMPAAGHMVHMPAHIYIRVGRYADAAEANERAIRADEDYLSQCQAQGLYPVSYYPHNLHFLWAAATLEGRKAVAVEAARKVAAKVPHHHAGALAWTADFPVTPLLAYARFGLWQDALTEPRPPATEPYATGIWHYSRGLAFIARNQLDRAASELTALKSVMKHEAFASTLKDLPLLTNLQIASRIVEGELAARREDAETAIRVLREAVAIEDGLPYSEPPIWHQPTRQVLGAILLEAGRATEAEEVYRHDLKIFRENGWSLFGLMESLKAQLHRSPEAAEVERRFEKAWARADVKLTSSRIAPALVPGIGAASAKSASSRPDAAAEQILVELHAQAQESATRRLLGRNHVGIDEAGDVVAERQPEVVAQQVADLAAERMPAAARRAAPHHAPQCAEVDPLRHVVPDAARHELRHEARQRLFGVVVDPFDGVLPEQCPGAHRVEVHVSRDAVDVTECANAKRQSEGVFKPELITRQEIDAVRAGIAIRAPEPEPVLHLVRAGSRCGQLKVVLRQERPIAR